MGNDALLHARAPGWRVDAAWQTGTETRDHSCRRPTGQVGEYLAAIAAGITARGVPGRLTRIGGTAVLTIDQPAAGPDPITVTVVPGTGNDSGLPVDCTCLWTPAPGTTPEAAADTIAAVPNALRRAMKGG